MTSVLERATFTAFDNCKHGHKSVCIVRFRSVWNYKTNSVSAIGAPWPWLILGRVSYRPCPLPCTAANSTSGHRRGSARSIILYFARIYAMPINTGHNRFSPAAVGTCKRQRIGLSHLYLCVWPIRVLYSFYYQSIIIISCIETYYECIKKKYGHLSATSGRLPIFAKSHL